LPDPRLTLNVGRKIPPRITLRAKAGEAIREATMISRKNRRRRPVGSKRRLELAEHG
jgi:hypothetical protein